MRIIRRTAVFLVLAAGFGGSGCNVDQSGLTAAGGGGTDFRPVFDWVAERCRRGEARPDALIYCTDGWGTFPPRAPDYPLVWGVTPGSHSNSRTPERISVDHEYRLACASPGTSL